MVAIMDKSGAYLYNTTKNAFKERLASEKGYNGIPKYVDYDERGNARKNDGMIGWLFMTPQLIPCLSSAGCEAIFIADPSRENIPYKILEKDDFEALNNLLRRIMEE